MVGGLIGRPTFNWFMDWPMEAWMNLPGRLATRHNCACKMVLFFHMRRSLNSLRNVDPIKHNAPKKADSMRACWWVWSAKDYVWYFQNQLVGSLSFKSFQVCSVSTDSTFYSPLGMANDPRLGNQYSRYWLADVEISPLTMLIWTYSTSTEHTCIYIYILM